MANSPGCWVGLGKETKKSNAVLMHGGRTGGERPSKEKLTGVGSKKSQFPNISANVKMIISTQ